MLIERENQEYEERERLEKKKKAAKENQSLTNGASNGASPALKYGQKRKSDALNDSKSGKKKKTK